ncbi:hypothetical protein BKA64DRAFT_635143 [Cadophora sp. MPI-SDFR-AT-0126]|nr:hypothetical protein BKA64DRAFT_635143 [Leotiomycetes sp. MPI-SDFR-AT-0126]
MSDRRLPVGPKPNIRAKGRRATENPPPRAPTRYNTKKRDQDTDPESYSDDPALKPYRRPVIPRFKGPTKEQRTARQFDPLSELPLSADEQWRNWKAEQDDLEREHNERREVLLRERDLRKRRLVQQASEDEEEDEGDGDVENRYRYSPKRSRFPPRPKRRSQPQHVRNEQVDEEEEETELEDEPVSPPRRRFAPQTQRRKRVGDEQLGSDNSNPRRFSSPKRRRLDNERREPTYAPSRRHPHRTPSPPRGPARHRPQNRFVYDTPSNGHEHGSSRPRQSRSSYPGPPPAPPGYRPSHPGAMLPQIINTGRRPLTSFYGSPARPRSHPDGTPAHQDGQRPEPSSPGLFVSQSPSQQVEENWPYAEVKEEPGDDPDNEPGPTTPLRPSQAQDPRATPSPEENASGGAVASIHDLKFLAFDVSVVTMTESILGASVADIEVTCPSRNPPKVVSLQTVPGKIELLAQNSIGTPLGDLALVNESGFRGLKKAYRKATDKAQRYKEELQDKDREIERLNEIVQLERRDREEDQG